MRRVPSIPPTPSAGDPRLDGGLAGGAGAVLRGIALHREPRLLPHAVDRPTTRAAPAGGGREPAPIRSGGDPERDGAARDTLLEEALRRGYDAGLSQGLDEGRRQGLEQGREAGRRAVEREAEVAVRATAERLTLLDVLLASLPAELARRLAASEDDLVALCHAAVCRILGEELVTADAVVQVVREGLRAACGGPQLPSSTPAALTIHVHPRQLDLLRSDERIAAWLGPARAEGPRWVADEAVQLGGCIVSTGEGTLDARLETQLAALRAVLTQGRVIAPAAAEG